MRCIPPGDAVVSFLFLGALSAACTPNEPSPQQTPSETAEGNAQATEAQIAQRRSVIRVGYPAGYSRRWAEEC
jgi:hypothetical protein